MPSIRHREQLRRMLHLIEYMQANCRRRLPLAAIAAAFNDARGDKWHARTIRRDLELLADMGWLDATRANEQGRTYYFQWTKNACLR